MELEAISVTNFKRISSVKLDLASVNILVGGNGSGKSSVLQAIHLGCCLLRQASRVEQGRTSTVNIEELDYLPTNRYMMLGHQAIWGNTQGKPSSELGLHFVSTDDSSAVKAQCQMRSARNLGISITGTVPTSLTTTLRRKEKFFSAYIPGISGLPNVEEKKSKKVILKSCSYGDSNVILRNVLWLLRKDLGVLEQWVSDLIGDIKIEINFDEEKDLFLECNVISNGDKRPLELIGTGCLQLIQLFAYILLFRPGILLVDEPDIHLHPDVQERLPGVLQRVANERNLKIILSTHSPFIVRGAPLSAKTFWLSNGVLETEDRGEIEFALGWGAFGKKILIITEDEVINILRYILKQWPELDKAVSVIPGVGYAHLPTPVQAKSLVNSLGGKYKILVHRDRDSLTDKEVEIISKDYINQDIDIWFPEESDIEAYFCSPVYLAEHTGKEKEECETILNNILSKQSKPIYEQFEKQRKSHNDELWPKGGSPENQEVWNAFQSRSLRGAKGKFVFKQLKCQLQSDDYNFETIVSVDRTHEFAPSLKTTLQDLMH